MITRRAAGIAIVGSWVFCVGWAVARQVRRPPEAFLDASAARLAPGAAFYEISLGGAPIGNAGITLDTTLAGYRLTEVWNMDLAGETSVARHVLRSDAELSRSLLLRKVSVTMSEAGSPRLIEADAGNDTTWEVTVRRPGTRPTPLASIEAPGTTSAPGALPFRLVLEGRLGTGATITQPVLAIIQGTVDHDSARVTRDSMFVVADSAVWDSAAATWQPVAGPPTRAWRIERTVHGFSSIDWVDAQGRLIQRDWAFGLRLQRSPFEVNYNTYRARLRRGEIRPPAQVPGRQARGDLPGEPDMRRQLMVLRVARADGPAWPQAASAFAGGRQSVAGDTVTIRADTVEERIASLVRRASLAPWNDRVSTFLALAGAAGLTARAVSGLDMSRLELPAHSWAEVFTQGHWIAVDPVYGQAPTAVSMLRVAVGGADRPLLLVPLIGALRSTTLTIQ